MSISPILVVVVVVVVLQFESLYLNNRKGCRSEILYTIAYNRIPMTDMTIKVLTPSLT